MIKLQVETLAKLTMPSSVTFQALAFSRPIASAVHTSGRPDTSFAVFTMPTRVTTAIEKN